jgi:hypothetical protein
MHSRFHTVRVVTKPLQPPYDGSQVISSSKKSFKIDLGNRTDTTTMLPTATPPEDTTTTTTTIEEPEVHRTKSGRHVYFPERYLSIVYG